MARVECSTSINGIYCVCDYNAYPVGNYPNIVMRIDYSFRVRYMLKIAFQVIHDFGFIQRAIQLIYLIRQEQ